MKRITQKQQEREDRAAEAIIACLFRGKTSKRFWDKVFKRVKMIEELKSAQKRAKRLRSKPGSEPLYNY